MNVINSIDLDEWLFRKNNEIMHEIKFIFLDFLRKKAHYFLEINDFFKSFRN